MIEDITNQRFNKLLVLELDEIKNSCNYWKCLCDCGNTRIVRGDNLRSGHTKSCGCLHKEMLSQRNKIDLIGQRFGRLVVLEEAGRDKWGSTMWRCRCGCGAIKVVRGSSLRGGLTRSCGCLIVELSRLRCGEDNPNYNPNLTDEERIYNRDYSEYTEWRTAVFERDDFTCQYCGDNRGGNLVAHHFESYTDNPELRTLLENGITLCEECHKNFHHQYGYGNNTRKQFEEFLRARKKLEEIRLSKKIN